MLLAWGGFAAVYSLSGRILRSLTSAAVLAPAAAAAVAEHAQVLRAYRDDGPVAVALGRMLARVGGPPAIALALLAALPLLAAVAVAGAGASHALVVAAVGWAVLAGGVSSGRPLTDGMRWLVPPVLRALEYAGLIWIAAVAGPSSLPAAFALLCAIAYHHYDIVYGRRHRGRVPPQGLQRLGGAGMGAFSSRARHCSAARFRPPCSSPLRSSRSCSSANRSWSGLASSRAGRPTTRSSTMKRLRRSDRAADGVSVVPAPGTLGGVASERVYAEVARMRVEATRLHVEGRVEAALDGPAYLFARRRGDVTEVVAPARLDGESFFADLDLAELALPGDQRDVWNLGLVAGRRSLRLGRASSGRCARVPDRRGPRPPPPALLHGRGQRLGTLRGRPRPARARRGAQGRAAARPAAARATRDPRPPADAATGERARASGQARRA